MRYRKLGKTDVDVSILGFGAMRLPMVGNPEGLAGFDPNIPIDEVEATKMIHHALEHGVNYFDTAYAYHGGQSETFVGKVLKQHRKKVMIATKLPVWNVQTSDDFEKLLTEQLGKLQTDYLDFYLIHGLDRNQWLKMKDLGVLDFMAGLRSGGRIRFAGFSFHDSVGVFKEIIDAFDWDMCQIQFNFYDENHQAGKEGLEYAASKNIGVVVMEPLRGGKLVDKIPPEIQALWDSAPVQRSPVEWAMRWVWSHKEVSTTLTGSSTLAQLSDHTKMLQQPTIDSLSAEEMSLFGRVRAEYEKKLKVDCTGCGYCMPCPNGVDIPRNFQIYNDNFLFTGAEFNSVFYNRFLNPEQRASGCFECLICLEKCPQKIDIPEELKKVHKLFGEE
jgi:predicted aldo/keto reductase-like oxidoreductase